MSSCGCCNDCARPAFNSLNKWQQDHIHTVHIDSRARIDNGNATSDPTYPSNFTIPTPSNINGQKIYAAKLVGLEMTNKFRNVLPGQIIDFSESGGPSVTALIPEGNYSTATLAIAIKNALELGNGTAITYSVIRDNDTKKYTITPSAGTVAFLFHSGLNASKQHGNGGVDENYVYNLMGFDKRDTASLPIQISPNMFSIQWNQYFYIAIDPLNHSRHPRQNQVSQRMESELYKTTFRIPIPVGYTGGLWRLNHKNPVWFNSGSSNETSNQTWTIRILDQSLKEASIPGCEWSMTLSLYMIPDHWMGPTWNKFTIGNDTLMSTT